MQRYLLNIAYIGTKYNGTTKNINVKNHVSIQDIFEQAFNKTRATQGITIFPSSRTDSGVHATNTTAHIDLERYVSPSYITKSLNATLQAWNEQIRILKTTPINNDFDSRREAIGRTYLYRIAVCKEKVPAGIKPKTFKHQIFIPIEESFRCHFELNIDFDIDRVREVANMLVGIHDFKSFMKPSKEQRTFGTRFCLRSIESIDVRPGTTIATSFNAAKTLELYDFWDIEFKSKAYFYRQIRNMVSTMLAAGNNRISMRNVYEMLTIPSKYSWLSHIKPVSPSALYLTNVEYRPGSIPDYECDDDENENENVAAIR